MRPYLLHDHHLLQQVAHLLLRRVVLGRLHPHQHSALVPADVVRLGLPDLREDREGVSLFEIYLKKNDLDLDLDFDFDLDHCQRS